MSGHPSIVLASVYLSPTKPLLESDIRALLSLGDSVILAGDLNAKHSSWNCHVTNTNGTLLDKLWGQSDLNFTISAPDEATRYPVGDQLTNGQRPSILDLALLKNIASWVSTPRVLQELSSDHFPVLLQLGPPPSAAPPTKTVIDYRKLSERLVSIDSVHISKIPDNIESIDDAQAASLHLTNHIQNALSECSREMPSGFTRRQLPEDARELIRIKNSKRRAHHACPTDENRRELWRAQREVKARIAELRDEQWDRKLSELTPSHVAFYSLARTLKADPVSATPPLIRPDLPPAFEDSDKAECLADSLAEQCSPSTVSFDKDHVELVESKIASLHASAPSGDPLTPTTHGEVRQLIKELHSKKAPGPDSINNKTLKLLPDQLINLLVVIFNALMAGCTFPDRWKEATVIGIPKPGKPKNLPTSYRPISLLNTLGKVYEKVILNRLKAVVEEKSLLNDEQFGFRAQHSCVHQAHRLTEHILRGFQSMQRTGTPTGAVFFDVAKAFDKVWHAGLIYKLYQMGVPDRLVRLLREYLTNRTFRYRLDGTLSTPRPIRAGVPQGSVLSPLLYALYTSDIPREPRVSIAQFADDTALYFTHHDIYRIRSALQKAVSSLGDWFRLWRIEVNPDKSAAILFEKSKRSDAKLQTRKPITLNGKSIPWRKKVKYLGVTFDKKMTFAAHIRRVRNKAVYVLCRLYPMLCAKSKISLVNKVTLYKVCIRPIMTYAHPVFAYRPHYAYKPLQIIQNRFMRMATGSPWYMRNKDLHRDLQLPTIAQFMKQLCKDYFAKAGRHPNQLVVDMINYNPDRNDPPDKRRPKHVLYDTDDQTTTDNAPYMLGQHTNTNQIQRLRRRRRGPRFLTSPGRGHQPRPRGRQD